MDRPGTSTLKAVSLHSAAVGARPFVRPRLRARPVAVAASRGNTHDALRLAKKKIVSSSVQVTPSGFVAGAIATAVPPLSARRFNWPPWKNPTASPSGDMNGWFRLVLRQQVALEFIHRSQVEPCRACCRRIVDRQAKSRRPSVQGNRTGGRPEGRTSERVTKRWSGVGGQRSAPPMRLIATPPMRPVAAGIHHLARGIRPLAAGATVVVSNAPSNASRIS